MAIAGILGGRFGKTRLRPEHVGTSLSGTRHSVVDTVDLRECPVSLLLLWLQAEFLTSGTFTHNLMSLNSGSSSLLLG